MSSKFSFVSWVQNPLTSRSAERSTSLRPVLRVSLNLSVGGEGIPTDTVAEELALCGPGDVIGLQPEAVLKTTPPAGEQQYSPLRLPSIEFYEEDLPWRYSPKQAGGSAEQRAPWCFLLTLKQGEFKIPPHEGGPLPVVEVTDLSVFPAASETWLWAHVQVNQELPIQTPPPSIDPVQSFLDGALRQNPDLAFSRLLSPRKLDPNATYHAFLIPAYETGRLAGLGEPVPLAPTATLTATTPAWGPGTVGSRKFPVYFQWEFRTGDAGDFESMARRLRPQRLNNFGSQPLAVVTPLGSQGSGPPLERIVNLPGIAQPVGAPAGVAVSSRIVADLVGEVNQGLAPSLPPPGTYRRPVVAPPAYGRAYVGALPAAGLTAASPPPDWFHQLNLHPAYRALAAIGGNVIQENQEEYMDQAWAQVQDVIAANMNLRGMQSGLQTTTSLRRQHLPLTGASGAVSASGAIAPESAQGAGSTQQRTATEPEAPATTIVQESSPGEIGAVDSTGGGGSMENYGLHLTSLAFTRLRNPETGLTLHETVRQSRVPLAAFAPAFRRIVKPFGRYQTGQAGRPLRPTQTPPPVASPNLLEPGSPRQQDRLLALMAQHDPGDANSAGITGAQPKDRLIRTFQFDDAGVDRVLTAAGHPAHALFYDPVSEVYQGIPFSDESGSPGKAFAVAFSSFKQVRFSAADPANVDPIKPALDLELLKQVLIDGTRPGPIYLARANRALRLLPHYGNYGGEEELLEAAPIMSRSSGDTATAGTETPESTAGTETTFSSISTATGAAPLLEVQPIMAYPVFKEPMSEQLRRRHPELFIPNIGDFPSNVVTLLEYNHAFIEAYMVGLNHAFGSELLWREYPTDLRGTYFRQFWDVSEKLNTRATSAPTPAALAAEEEALRDITPIPAWGNRLLGTNYPGQNRPELLLAVRGDLLRRYPNTVVCAVPGSYEQTRTVPNFSDPAKPVLYPVHRTLLGQDIVLLSFELSHADALADQGYFFVFHERPGEPEFGLDDRSSVTTPITATASNLARWGALAWQHLGFLLASNPGAPVQTAVAMPAGGLRLNTATPLEPFDRVDSSAKLAYALFQQPFMVALHASQMGI